MSEDQGNKMADDIVQLARLGMSGKPQDIQTYVRRIIRRVKGADEALAKKLSNLVAKAPSIAAPMRDAGGPMIPVDVDTRLQLARHEFPVILDRKPILTEGIERALRQVVKERSQTKKLADQGLLPTRSVLFTGPPGVGKTFSARMLAAELNVPLVTLDLSAVMSSFLGKTGNNLRNVLDYAKSHNCVLLLDEFDAIAKRRDDETEVGELKRLVTVLLQEIDEWPSGSLLIAATNHHELLDPAVWRRFDITVEFPMPSPEMLHRAVIEDFDQDWEKVGDMAPILERVWNGQSFSDVERFISRIRRRSAIDGTALSMIAAEMLSEQIKKLSHKERKNIAGSLKKAGLSDHKNYGITGVSRDVLRKMDKA